MKLLLSILLLFPSFCHGMLSVQKPVRPVNYGWFPGWPAGRVTIGANCFSNDIVSGMVGTNGWKYLVLYETAGGGGQQPITGGNFWTNTFYSNSFVGFPFDYSCNGQQISIGNAVACRTYDGVGSVYNSSSNTQFFDLIPPALSDIYNAQIISIISAHQTNGNLNSSHDYTDAYFSGSAGTGAEVVLHQLCHGTFSPLQPNVTRNETVGYQSIVVLHYGTNVIPAFAPIVQYTRVESQQFQSNEIYNGFTGNLIGTLFCDFTQTATLGFTNTAAMSYINHINFPLTTSHNDTANVGQYCNYYMFAVYTNDMTVNFSPRGGF